MSYLLGEWKHGGWWHYYLYGLAVERRTERNFYSVWLMALICEYNPKTP